MAPHLDLYLKTDSIVHALDPRAKLVALCGLLLAVMALPPRPLWPLGLLCLLLGLAAALARLPALTLGRRLLPLALVVGVPFALSRLGDAATCRAGEVFAAKSVLVAAAFLVLTASTRPLTLLETVGRVPLLSACSQLAAFILRGADLLAGEAVRTNRARSLRVPATSLRMQVLGLAWASISLLTRAAVRSERVGAAMALRGFRGAFPAPVLPPLPWSHLLAATAYALLALGIAGGGRWL